MRWTNTIAVFGCLIFLIGCGTTGVGRGLVIKNAGKEKIVERSDHRPDWAIEQPTFVKGGVLYASGMFTDAPNLGKGLSVANKLAQAKVIESIRMRMRNDFTYASEGLTTDSTILEQILTTTTDEMVVSGFFQNKQYYEKKEIRGLSGIAYKYDCYSLAEITQENYMKALDAAFNKYENKGGVTPEFREKVNKRQEQFFNEGKVDTE